MSKGFEWVKARASNPQLSQALAESDWSKANEVSKSTTINTFISVSRTLAIAHNPFNQYQLAHGSAEYSIKLLHNEDADFQYLASSSCRHDGTFLFEKELIYRVAAKVLTLQTCYLPYAEQLAKSGIHTIHWTIGNFVLLDEYGDQYALDGKPWMKSRSTVLLPLKMEVGQYKKEE